MTRKSYLRNKESALSVLFHKNYIPQISQEVIDQFCGSYITHSDIKNAWRKELSYSKELSDFLIFKTKIFIRMLDSRKPESSNPEFLKGLTGLIADYLSAYFMKDCRFITRKKAKQFLEQELYGSNRHIQVLLQEQAIKREKREARNAFYQNKKSANSKPNCSQTEEALQKLAKANAIKNSRFGPDRIR